MKPELSLESEEEPTWVSFREIGSDARMNLTIPPSKIVLKLIQAIEEGHFPLIFVNPQISIALSESDKAYEAYLRCHISVIPIVYKMPEEREKSNAPNSDI